MTTLNDIAVRCTALISETYRLRADRIRPDPLERLSVALLDSEAELTAPTAVGSGALLALRIVTQNK